MKNLTTIFNGSKFAISTFFIASSLSINNVYAEGSRDLYPEHAQGYRAYLMSRRSLESAHFAPFQTSGTMKVYAKAGEKIHIGFSQQGKSYSGNVGHIVVRRPNGTIHGTSGTSSSTGLIANRNEELGGPHTGTGTKPLNKYKPYTVTVGAGYEGIWEVDFMSMGDGTNHSATARLKADTNWVQSTEFAGTALIAAWDITVQSATNELLTGRVFSTIFVGTTINAAFNQKAFYGSFYVLTPDGYSYLVNGNGMNGASFSFFSNNKGPRNKTTGIPTYKSFSYPTSGDLVTYISDRIWDPRKKDTGGNTTNKLFYNPPAFDLPPTATWTNGPVSSSNPTTSTWLKNETTFPTITDIMMELDGTIRFHSDVNTNYSMEIQTLDGIVIKTIQSSAVSDAENIVIWDKKDELGNNIPAGTQVKIVITTFKGEVHFPFIDAESNIDGLKIQLLDDDYLPIPSRDSVYWDDSEFTSASTGSDAWSGRPIPLSNLTGLKSIGSAANGHKWSGTGGTSESHYFGNNKVIDTWAYIVSPLAIGYGTLGMTVNGYVWNDLNANSLKESNEFNISNSSPDPSVINIGTDLYIHALNEAEQIIGTSMINNDGKFSIKNIPSNTNDIKLIISINDTSTFDINNNHLLENWIFVSENVGMENDAIQSNNGDGIIEFNAATLTFNENFNFGIQQRPNIENSTTISTINPGKNRTIQVPHDILNTTDFNYGVITEVTIISFPENAESIHFNEEIYEHDNWPAEGIIIQTDSLGNLLEELELNPMSGDIDVIFNFIVKDNGGAYSIDTGIVTMKFHTVSASGKIFIDPNGMIDSIINGEEPGVSNFYITLIETETDEIVQSVEVQEDGKYTVNQIEGGEPYYLKLTGSEGVAAREMYGVDLHPFQWVHTGELLGLDMGDDGNNDGILHLGILESEILDAQFGIQRKPIADPKSFIVEESDFYFEPILENFPYIENFKSIPMQSDKLVGFAANGSLSGTDAEDCESTSSCNTNTHTTYSIISVYPNTKLYYNFGESVGIVELFPMEGSSIIIPDFDADRMMIYGLHGQGSASTPFGFTYSMLDQANYESNIVEYEISTPSPLNVNFIHFSATKFNEKGKIEWTTSKEDNVKSFQILRSTDGITWDWIGTSESKNPQGISETSTKYQFLDLKPRIGKNLYRIKQLDFNNYYYFSEVKSLEFSSEKISTEIFPNPASNKITLSNIPNNAVISMWNNLGQHVETITPNQNNYQWNISRLTSGNYYIHITIENQIIQTIPFNIIK